MELLKDPKLRSIQWKDLTILSGKETLIENNITLPWVLLSWIMAYFEWYILALPFSFIFFLAALRQVHNGFHQALGVSKFFTWLSLYLNSILMLSSMHAVKFNHLRHHKYCLQEEDYEGKSARMNALSAIVYGPVHVYQMHKIALQHGNHKLQRNIMLELISIVALITIVFVFDITFLKYHIAAMLVGECLSAFFAVWTVHHDCDTYMFARTQRSGWKNFLTLSMFYHLEHHLFPQVPTIKLPELARRLDEQMPELIKKEVF